MRYAVRLSKDDNGTFLATVPDVPGAITYGETKAEALERAVDAVLTVFDERQKRPKAPRSRSRSSRRRRLRSTRR